MKFRRIFGDNVGNKLFAVCYPEDKDGKKEVDIFRKNMRQWNDDNYLYSFFSENYADLLHPFWGGITIDDAMDQVMDEAQHFESELRAIEEKEPRFKDIELSEIFEELHTGIFLLRGNNWMQRKAKPNFKTPMLRIYSILFDGHYIITGGAIKLIHKMEGEYFENEKRKLNELQKYLNIQQIVSIHGLDEDL